MVTVAELLARKAELEKQIADAQREQRATVLAQIRTLMNEHGLTLADLSSPSGARRAGGGASKVAPKYRNPATGETWTGRGLQPKWLKAALAQGRTLTEFSVA